MRRDKGASSGPARAYTSTTATRDSVRRVFASLPTLLGLLAFCSGSVWSAEPLSSAEPGPITYSTIDEALKDLHAKAGVTFRNQDGWIVAEDLAASAAWLITPPGHPAYPSMVRRMVINTSTGAYMDTAVRCLASKETCDKFFAARNIHKDLL